MDSIQSALDEFGYIHLEQQSREKLDYILSTLGNVILTTDVKINNNSKALVTSDCALDVHTDHNKANYIAWFCLKQTDIGGHSIMVDSKPLLEKLSDNEIDSLSRLNLYEHKVFDDDPDTYPLLKLNNGKIKIYYSFWLANDEDKLNPIFQKFRKLVDSADRIYKKIEPMDVLVVDNHRILHGRTQIEGTKNRHLKRFWIN